MEEFNLRIVETKEYIFQIKEGKYKIALGSYALHGSDWYRTKYPEVNHLVLCTESNQSSMEEHWRQVVGHLPKVGADMIENIPLLNVYNY